MRKTVFIGIFQKKQVHPGPGKILHAHRMDFTGFVRGPMVFADAHIPAAVNLESMTGFVGQDINILAAVIKIRKNIRRLVLVDVGTIASCRLTGFGFQVHQVTVAHEAEKSVGLRRKFGVHPGCIFYNPVGVAFGFGVAGGEPEIVIVMFQDI